MGIPKFYRWVSERYPSLSKVVKGSEVPEIDNFYLDMNGIIHNCSHPNDVDPNFVITEEQIFKDTCDYINALFRIIRPKKLFYMAVDGVAPRAKMNQQRARRFRSVQEAEMAAKKAEREGKLTSNAEDRFDSNCITPGTAFMARLQKALESFVENKLLNEPSWKQIKVILDGHECPGEGEHKILDYIRAEKHRQGYDPNTRHCMYGLDADLMVLGLASHEPHFCLLREEVKFGGRQNKRESKAEAKNWHILSLTLFREYISYEFDELKTSLPFAYDFERLIDDWVLLGFLVGNDFLPHLPNFHIGEDIKPFIYKCYKNAVRKMDGWITDGGYINLERLEILFKELAIFDDERFGETYVDLKWMAGKSGKKPGKGTGKTFQPFFAPLAVEDEDDNAIPEDYFPAKEDEPEEMNEEDSFQEEFKFYKMQYYMSKLHVEAMDDKGYEEFLLQQAQEYVKGLQWCLLYYFRGVPSWSWFYPYHYAPFCSDVVGFASYQVNLSPSKPFLPFQQLMAVLPPGSKKHVPSAFHPLMLSEMSPIIDFYPLEFETDLNGKKQDWEALVLIPFIDEKRLLEAMETRLPHLSVEERGRNIHSKAIEFQLNLDSEQEELRQRQMSFPHCPVSEPFISLLDGTDLQSYRPGFPSFRFYDIKVDLYRAKVRVFDRPSNNESVIVSLSTQRHSNDPLEDAIKLLGKPVWFNAPHLIPGIVTEISNDQERVILSKSKIKRIKHSTDEEIDDWKRSALGLRERQLVSKGINCGDVKVIALVQKAEGESATFQKNGKIVRETFYAKDTIKQPFQMLLNNINVVRDGTSADGTVNSLYPPGAKFVYLGQPHYGSIGTILSVNQDNQKVKIRMTQHRHPKIPKSTKGAEYFALNHAAARCGMKTRILNRITSSWFVFEGTEMKPGGFRDTRKTDVGLKLKSNKQDTYALGYVKRTDNGQWLLSQATVDIILEYVKKFPKLFEILENNFNENELFEGIHFPDGCGVDLKEIKAWIKQLPTNDMSHTKGKTILLHAGDVAAIEKAQTELVSGDCMIELEVNPRLVHVLSESDSVDTAGMEKPYSYMLGDRVVCIKNGSPVPVLSMGNVVGISGPEQPPESVDVVFDSAFNGGSTLDGRCSRGRGLRLSPKLLLHISGAYRHSKLELPGQEKHRKTGKSGPNVDSNPEATAKLFQLLKMAPPSKATPTTDTEATVSDQTKTASAKPKSEQHTEESKKLQSLLLGLKNSTAQSAKVSTEPSGSHIAKSQSNGNQNKKPNAREKGKSGKTGFQASRQPTGPAERGRGFQPRSSQTIQPKVAPDDLNAYADMWHALINKK
eukprot:m.15885 g.15885  ORF g.15885 m.15885 type:complete len:1314 (+) comp5516_c0_seq1:151-4092(+)